MKNDLSGLSVRPTTTDPAWWMKWFYFFINSWSRKVFPGKTKNGTGPEGGTSPIHQRKWCVIQFPYIPIEKGIQTVWVYLRLSRTFVRADCHWLMRIFTGTQPLNRDGCCQEREAKKNIKFSWVVLKLITCLHVI